MRGLGPLVLLGAGPLVPACGAELLPGEVVLGEELATIEVEGLPGDALGSALAVAGDQVLVGAPGAGRVELWDRQGMLIEAWQGPPGLGSQVGLHEGRAWALEPGVALWWLGEEQVPTEAEVVATCPDGSVVEGGAGEALACSERGLLELRCQEAGCEVRQGQLVLAAVSSGGSVAWDGELPCWGDPELAEEPAPGAWACGDGSSGQGQDGEHLGAHLGGERVSGVFDKWTVPARGRIRSRTGAPTWVVDAAAWKSPLVVASGGTGWTAVGVPGHPGEDLAAGLVHLVEAP